MYNLYNKIVLKKRTEFMNLETKKIIYKILDKNTLISTLAKEEFLKRDLSDLVVDEKLLNKVISKFTIEELWYLVNLNIDNHFVELVSLKLNQILDYYQSLNQEDFLRKRNEGKAKIYFFK